MKLADILNALTGLQYKGASLEIRGASIDSRQVTPKCAFFALKGEQTDGHDYIKEAFNKGARLAVIEHDVFLDLRVVDLRPGLPGDFIPPSFPFCLRVESSLAALQQIARWWRSQHAVKVTGITGSVGKSTSKEMVAQVLSQCFNVLKNPGNLNNEIGLPLTLLQLEKAHDCAVLEMGFYVPGEIAFLCEIAKPQVGVITNIGSVHAERAGSKEVIARGKAELVQALPAEGTAILNFDDPLVRPMAEKTTAQVIFYGLDPQADLWADHIESLGLEGIEFRLHHHREEFHIHAPLIGRHSVQTVLRAAAVGLAHGLTWEQICAGIQQGPSQLRLVPVRSKTGALILDDTYNASPESMLAALNLLAELEGRKIAVLGDMLELGPYEREGHEVVGRRAAEVCSILVTVGELGQLIADAALSEGLPASAVVSLPEVVQVSDALKQMLGQGDVVLVKGSHGLHMERIIADLEEIQ